jgi:hypothetical protein
MSSSGVPVASVTLSGVHFAMTSFFTSSMPYTRWRMYSLSSQPFLKMWCSTPKISGTSLPERKRTYLSALAAVRVKRGSATITLQPFSLACRVCSIDTGCASAALEPRNSKDLEFCSSL